MPLLKSMFILLVGNKFLGIPKSGKLDVYDIHVLSTKNFQLRAVRCHDHWAIVIRT